MTYSAPYNGPVRIKLDCGHVQKFTQPEAREIKRIRQTQKFYCTQCGQDMASDPANFG